MRHFIKTSLLLLAIMLPMTAMAYDFVVDGICYKTDLWGDFAMVADWGEDGNHYTGIVTIPESVTNDDTTYPVQKIGAYAFAECSELTGVIIPNSITEIEDHAFENCTGMTNLTIPETVTTIGSRAFASCTSLTSIDIPASITTFGIWAFLNCDNLKDVYLHISDPEVLGGWAFSLDSEQYAGRTLHVPAGCANTFKESELAQYFENIVDSE